jgi:hypothetical protein
MPALQGLALRFGRAIAAGDYGASVTHVLPSEAVNPVMYATTGLIISLWTYSAHEARLVVDQYRH